jgi:hypothetical protein
MIVPFLLNAGSLAFLFYLAYFFHIFRPHAPNLEDGFMTTREAIDIGAFTWARVQRLYDADPAVHWRQCESEELECPLEVFTQVFHEEANNADFSTIVRAVDWSRVRWELEEFSGVALRQVRVDRGFQYALDEARERTAQFGIRDEREAVVNHWRDVGSWFAPPVMVAGEVLGTNIGYELLVGFTRLGNLLGLLDREEIAEVARHLVWVGRGMIKTS